MKLLLPLLVAVLAIAQVFCEEIDPKEDLEYWTNSDKIQDEWLATVPLREMLRRMTRKPRPNQFFGLMGKRSSADAQITRKRHRLNSFMGLMGKRSQEEPDLFDWSTIQNDDRRR